jgi:hypothetical protein
MFFRYGVGRPILVLFCPCTASQMTSMPELSHDLNDCMVGDRMVQIRAAQAGRLSWKACLPSIEPIRFPHQGIRRGFNRIVVDCESSMDIPCTVATATLLYSFWLIHLIRVGSGDC